MNAGPGNLTPAPTPPPPSDRPAHPTHSATPVRSNMSRVTPSHESASGALAADESDAAMGFAGEELGSAASSESSIADGDDDLMRDDELAAEGTAGEVGEEVMVTEADADDATSVPAFSTGGAAPVYPPSPSGPSGSSSRRSGSRPYPTRGFSGAGASGSGGAGGGSGSRPSRRERANQAFSGGGGEFERERANIEGRRRGFAEGQEGEGRSPEEIALAKVIDKEYTGKLNVDPFWSQVCAIRQAKAAAANGDHAPMFNGSSTLPASAGGAPSTAAVTTGEPASLPPPVPLVGNGDAASPAALADTPSA
ncbi:hypothetical protein JCM10908_001535 [Rhodotorula pacifica]|uniref:uncharacterized protein n=1 Tax=Rhodotorula pacifica TaxID=1495444 RepID=UPI0031789AC6